MYLISLFVTSCIIIRGCDAFHLRRGNNRPPLAPLLESNSKFPGIMAAEEVSSPPQSNGFEPLTWHDEYDMNGNKRCITVLPDDELPPTDIVDVPPMHNKRTLYYQPSLISKDEATSLHYAAKHGKFIESNQLLGIIEDGVDVAASLTSILDPILTSKILPWAREVSSTPTLTVADALIRIYDPSQECLHLSEHYDEAAFATVIIPLNDPNEYEGVSYMCALKGVHGGGDDVYDNTCFCFLTLTQNLSLTIFTIKPI